MVENLPAMQTTWVQSLGQEDALEKEMASHSSILAWRIPWTEEPGGLQSMGLQRAGHDWATHTHSTLNELITSCLNGVRLTPIIYSLMELSLWLFKVRKLILTLMLSFEIFLDHLTIDIYMPINSTCHFIQLAISASILYSFLILEWVAISYSI